TERVSMWSANFPSSPPTSATRTCAIATGTSRQSPNSCSSQLNASSDSAGGGHHEYYYPPGTAAAVLHGSAARTARRQPAHRCLLPRCLSALASLRRRTAPTHTQRSEGRGSRRCAAEQVPRPHRTTTPLLRAHSQCSPLRAPRVLPLRGARRARVCAPLPTRSRHPPVCQCDLEQLPSAI